jgi:polypeptide N-acetylgalactosaminyltransferase
LYLTGWLEPLLDRIAENQTIVVAPTIDSINDKTLSYFTTDVKGTAIGGFNWNLVFNWHPIPEREWKRRARVVDPVW